MVLTPAASDGFWSAEVQVMLRPFAAYQRLASEPAPADGWGFLQRPLFQAFLLGAIASLGIARRLSLPLVLSAGIAWSFVPALQIASVLAVRRSVGHRSLPPGRSIDLYFMGQGPWLLWLLVLVAVQGLLPPERAAAAMGPKGPLFWSFAVPLLWSPLLTYAFLRGALQASRARALRALGLHTALIWGVVLGFFQLSGQLGPRLAGLFKG